MKKILVPTDFSVCAENAIMFAVQSSKLVPAEIILLHTVEVAGNLYTDYMGVNHEFSQSVIDNTQKELADLASRVSKMENIQISHALGIGTLRESIYSVVKEKGVDMIIMGTTGASGLDEKIWGSRTASVIGNTPVPVLAVPSGYEWKRPQKILFSTNHFEEDPVILNFLFELAGLFMATVYVVVFTDEDDDKAGVYLEHSRKLPHYEKFLKNTYHESTLTVKNIYGLEFEKSLQEYISQNGIDILTMVTYKRKFWDRIFHPSLTRKMSYHSKIPLLALPADRA